ncbi:Uma2 family endonuclease [Microcoleus sp. A006_D1]|uniref:Uma2 family endonuclease n=1 Tax=Microcoleus sp. A006_D1 TaxID=3055267 RepID=UPI002FD199C5
MTKEHLYRINTVWTGATQGSTSSYEAYSREYAINIEGKPPFVGSADPTFRGDAALYNPEDLLLMALSACHMLSYLALCARAGIRVISYSDAATGKMAQKNGKIRFTEVILHPIVTIEAGDDLEKARSLHDNAHHVCFIANSVNFPVLHEAKMLVKNQPKFYTPDEYRLLEETAEFRNEYRDGEIVPIAGSTIDRSQIKGNIFAGLDTDLQGKNAEVFISGLRLWIPRYRQGTYPDIMIIEGEPALTEGRNDEILNPVLIVEVLSKYSEDVNREDKFRFYRSIPEFREYVLVNQSEFLVAQYIKNESNQWLFQEYEGEAAIVSFAALGVQMSMSEIYNKVVFETEEIEVQQ